jgi:hypothetical protein
MSRRETLPKHEDDGSVVDYLDEDPEIPTQKYAIVSFLSPEKILKSKEKFFFEKFIEWQSVDWKIKGLEHFNAFLAKKYDLKMEELMKDAEEFGKVREKEIKDTDVKEQWEIFLLKHEKELQEMFDNSVEFRTNVRGVKVRRCFSTVEEAQVMAKVLQRKYPKDNLYIGKVGAWLPWEPSEHLMPEVEYAEKELNELMRRYKENEANKDIFFADERDAKVKAHKEENERRKKENAKALEDAAKPVHPSEGVIRE